MFYIFKLQLYEHYLLNKTNVSPHLLKIKLKKKKKNINNKSNKQTEIL